MTTCPSLNFGVVSEPRWDHSPVYIIGGGPSLRGFNLNKLRRQIVVAVNGSVSSLPWASAVVSADRVWIEKCREQVLGFQGEKYLISPDPVYEGPTWLKKLRDPGFSDDPSVINIGGTSGYAALNIAYLKKAKQVYLLGFDYNNTHSHWFDNYCWHSPGSSGLWAIWARAFESTKPQIAAAGMTVINCNPGSSITAFEKIRIEELTIK